MKVLARLAYWISLQQPKLWLWRLLSGKRYQAASGKLQ